MEKILLAYSGGLINSVAIHWLRYQRNFRVITFSANVGQPESTEEMAAQALALGAESAHVVDLRHELLQDYVVPTLRAGARYEGQYLMHTALSRPLMAREMIRMAREEGCAHVAHGSISKSNDQLRLETAIAMLAPDLKIHAPRRTWRIDSIAEAGEYAKRHGLLLFDYDLDAAPCPYTRDANIWGARASGGGLEDPSVPPAEDVYVMTTDPREAPDDPEEVTLGFEQGIPTRLDDRTLPLLDLVEELNRRAGRHGIGRTDHLENRFFAGKVREVYEAPAATVIYAARDVLDKLTSERETLRLKQDLGRTFAELVYQGLWFSDLREALSAFFLRLSRYLTGAIRLRLYKGTIAVLGQESPFALYDPSYATTQRGGTFDTTAMDGAVSLFVQKYRMLKRAYEQGTRAQQRGPSAARPAPHRGENGGRTGL